MPAGARWEKAVAREREQRWEREDKKETFFIFYD